MTDTSTSKPGLVRVGRLDAKGVYDADEHRYVLASDYEKLERELTALRGKPDSPAPTPPPLEHEDWTPRQALEFYAGGRHFDVVNGRTRILDTGAIASDALKQLSPEYAVMKGLVGAPSAVPVAWRKPVEPQYDYSNRYRFREEHGISAPEGWEPLYAEPRRASQPTFDDLLLARSCLTNLINAVDRFGPIDAGIAVAMGEAQQFLGGVPAETKNRSSEAAIETSEHASRDKPARRSESPRREALRACRSPYCECEQGKCTHPGCYDARGTEPKAVGDGAHPSESSAADMANAGATKELAGFRDAFAARDRLKEMEQDALRNRNKSET